MAAQPILECFQQQDKWFIGVVVTDGRVSPRDSLYKEYTDEDMRLVRFKEQRKAAVVGEFAAQIIPDIPNKVIIDASRTGKWTISLQFRVPPIPGLCTLTTWQISMIRTWQLLCG